MKDKRGVKRQKVNFDLRLSNHVSIISHLFRYFATMKAFGKKQLYILTILAALFLSAGWPARGIPFFLLFGFVPLLIVEEQLYRDRSNYNAMSFFKYAYLGMLLWNVLTTWWVCNATIVGGAAAIICNSFFMAMVLVLFHYLRLKTSSKAGYASLIFFWITFEYLHLNWQLSWPWLTLGNGFANYAPCVQWYEFTGPLGGSFWILLSNILILYIIKYLWLVPLNFPPRWLKQVIVAAAMVVILPLALSFFLYFIYTEKNDPVKIVVVQPNIDPYGEKFSEDYKVQVSKMLAQTNGYVDSTDDYLIFPETALTENIDENRWNESYSIEALKKYLVQYPRLSIITGAETFRVYGQGADIPASAHKIDNSTEYYDDYNSALEVDKSGPVQVYHKSKLVPGVESMPFQKLLAPIAKLAFDLGGTSGTLGTQKEPSVLISPNTGKKAGVAICYESIYGEYIGEFVRKGAQLIFIITNDGWWYNTPGYRQHFCYARLRALETRRCIARSANTGISAFINERGDVLQKTDWAVPAVICAKLNCNNYLSFYAAHGDYIGRFAEVLSCVMVAFLFLTLIRKQI